MRIAILTLLILFALPAHAQEWAFKVYLDKSHIGEHTFRLDEKDGAKNLNSSAKFNVKLLFINAYSYLHKAQETWRGDCLTSLEARTEENKEITQVKGELNSSEFKVDAPKGQLDLPTCVMTFAYWNPKMLQQSKLLNPQTGEWLDVRIKSMGMEDIDVRGKKVQAERYRLEATKMKIDLWYGKAQEWLALQSTTPEGYLINYKLK
jgi:hypothetical protein